MAPGVRTTNPTKASIYSTRGLGKNGAVIESTAPAE